MPTSLSFSATKVFRDKLIVKNLKPYRVAGSFTPPSSNPIYETQQRDLSVIDSPDNLIADSPFSDLLYTKNRFGPEGGFEKDLQINSVLVPSDPNQGPYPNFVANDYTPFNILFGRTGNLSQDSVLQQIGARTLRNNFEETIAREIEQRTIARANIIPALNDPIKALQVATGDIPIIEGNFQITRAANPVVAAADLTVRLGGGYIPTSQIPGAYFQIDQKFPGTVTQITNAFNRGLKTLGGAIGLNLNSLDQNPSQIFINNTGSWTRRRMFFNLDYNRYKPEYSRGLVDDVVQSVGGAIRNVFDIESAGGYYVGSSRNEPSRITSPTGEIPINQFGEPDISIVYGPDKLAKDYEVLDFNFGLAGKASQDNNGSIDGGFVWTSPKYRDNAGFNVKPGGDIGSANESFNALSAIYDSNTSSNKELKKGSILDETQRIINSQPEGSKRLSHVGNAMDQVSKVFNDGYREITKGSKVKSYLNSKGEPIINERQILKENEYCRLFTKDTPYYTFNNLQKKDRLVRSIEGLSTYSIMDSVYNLNLAPTNTNDGRPTSSTTQKKYMLSIENLAWRTSNRPGYRVSDLPECEKGPNGGRIMWFPPYGLSFSETISPSWQGTTFLGRPEPVYTYKDTSRTGQLSFTIIVDHPSILNLIVNKYLEQADSKAVNDIVDSFFAGCLKYDLYELAKIYNTIPIDKLLHYQEIIQTTTNEEVIWETIEDIPKENVKQTESNVENITFDEFKNISLYYDNDIPKSGSTIESYDVYYNTYKNQKSKYKGSAGTFFESVILTNFDRIDNNGGLRKKIYDTLTNDPKGTIVVSLIGTASSPNKDLYNLSLSQRRIDSIKQYFRKDLPGTSGLSEFIDTKRLRFSEDAQGETTIIPVSAATDSSGKNYIGRDIDCRQDIKDPNARIFSVAAAACRSIRISDIQYVQGEKPKPTPPPKPEPPNVRTEPRTKKTTTIRREKIPDYRGLTKRVIRHLLSECDYFKVLQADQPMIFNSMKEKIKHFNPAFHSATPEGLNARLTFLQQCTRPGDTIPTISTDGTLINNDAYNTAFGSPPVLVLRVGDFFNTKVLCNSINIQYEPLNFDLNPEGIGVQPMLAKISMGITFIGGSGLKEPVEQLQNALSFNYYANTEIYDDRAEATEDTKAFDEKFYNQIKAAQDAAKELEKQPEPEQPKNGGDAIGVLSQGTNTGGTINYREVMNKLLKQTNNYFNTLYNTLGRVGVTNNYGLLQLFNSERNYSQGNFFEFESQPLAAEIYGKPNYEPLLEKALETFLDQIKSGDTVLQKEVRLNKNLKEEDHIQLKQAMFDFARTIQIDFIRGDLSNYSSEIVKPQIPLVDTISRINFVMTNKDGKVFKDGNTEIYKLSGETSVTNKFINDFSAVSSGLTTFITNLRSDKIITTNKDYKGPDDYNVLLSEDTEIAVNGYASSVKFGNVGEKIMYLFYGDIFSSDDSLENLSKGLASFRVPGETKNSVNIELEKTLKVFLQARKELYGKQRELEKKLFKDNLSKYTTPSTPYDLTTDRILRYELDQNASNDDKTRLRTILDSVVNTNNNKNSFNGKKTFN